MAKKDEPSCPTCGGSGSVRETCGLCRGKGCSMCQGGTIWKTCPQCHGRGRL